MVKRKEFPGAPTRHRFRSKMPRPLKMEEDSIATAVVNPLTWSWESGHQKQMEDLLKTGFLSDATLILGSEKERVEVHQLILQKGSLVFYEKFRDRDTGQTEWVLQDVDPKMFMMLLQYLYTGESGAVIGVALAVLKLASDYKVTGLADQCAEILSGELTNQNVIDLFQQAEKYGRKELAKSAADYICKNAHAIVESEQFKDMQHDRLLEILGRDDFMVQSEIQLFEAIVKWGVAECSRQRLEVSDSSTRQVLDELIGLIRFPLMEREEFTLKVAMKNLLKMEELVSILLYFNVSDEKRSSIPPGRFNSSKREFCYDPSPIKYVHGQPMCTKCLLPKIHKKQKEVLRRCDRYCYCP